MKVLILHDGSSPETFRKVRAWLESADCKVSVLEVSNSSREEASKSLAEVIAQYDVVVLLFGDELSIADIQAGLLAARAKGKKIVGIHSPTGLTGNMNVREFEKHAFALVRAEEKAVVAAVCDDKPEWTNEEGQARPTPKTKRHKC